MGKIKLNSIIYLHIILLCSCNAFHSTPLDDAYALAGDHAVELEKVRTSAAYLEVLNNIDSLWRNGGNAAIIDSTNVLKNQWDSLALRYGAPRIREADVDMDLMHISSAQLIRHIDQVFKVWRESPWRASIDFDHFCEYLSSLAHVEIIPKNDGNFIAIGDRAQRKLLIGL